MLTQNHYIKHLLEQPKSRVVAHLGMQVPSSAVQTFGSVLKMLPLLERNVVPFLWRVGLERQRDFWRVLNEEQYPEVQMQI